jgi:hypothetical protein
LLFFKERGSCFYIKIEAKKMIYPLPKQLVLYCRSIFLVGIFQAKKNERKEREQKTSLFSLHKIPA